MHTSQGENKCIALHTTFPDTLQKNILQFESALHCLPQFGQFCVACGVYCVWRRFSAAYGSLAQFSAVLGIGAAYWPALLFNGRAGELVLNLYTSRSDFHLHPLYSSRQLPVIYCNVSVHFHSISISNISQAKLKYAHEVLFFVRNVARIYLEIIIPFVKYIFRTESFW